VEKGKLQEGLKISFGRVLSGFGVGVALGILIGFLMGLVPCIQKLLASIVSLLRPMPLMALIPVFIIIFGIGETTNISVIAIGTFWPTLLNTITGIQSTDKKTLEMAKVYNVPLAKIIFEIILPSAATSIVTGIRLSAGVAWSSVVAAEMIGASSGIGYTIMYAREVARSVDLFTYVIVIGLIGFLIEKVLVAVQRKCELRFYGRNL
jgi:sulfonate transport system permease protein